MRLKSIRVRTFNTLILGGGSAQKIFLYAMPLYIIGIEVAARHLPAGEAVNYALSGPTVAVAGLSLILPTLIPKRVPTPQNLPPNYTAVDKSDQRLIEVATIAFLYLSRRGFFQFT
jgi:hypothetical protein